MSDWGATHSTSINQGLDQEMPGEIYMGPSLLASVAAGNVTMAKIDESVARILAPMYRFKVFDNAAQWADPTLEYKDVRSAAHTEVARRIASNATVLLTNKNKALPLSRGAKVAVLGLNGAAPIVHGGGSGHVPSATTVSPLTGIQEAVGSQVVTPTPRCVMQHDVAYPQSVYSNKNSLVDPAPTSAAECCASCFAYGNSLISDECAGWSYGGARGCVLVFRNAPTKTVPSPGTTVGTCNGAEPITEGQVTFADEQSQEEATTLAKAADVAVVFVATTSSEGCVLALVLIRGLDWSSAFSVVSRILPTTFLFQRLADSGYLAVQERPARSGSSRGPAGDGGRGDQGAAQHRCRGGLSWGDPTPLCEDGRGDADDVHARRGDGACCGGRPLWRRQPEWPPPCKSSIPFPFDPATLCPRTPRPDLLLTCSVSTVNSTCALRHSTHAFGSVVALRTDAIDFLQITVPNVNNEVKFTQAQYPGIDNATSYYSEKLLVGYRWYTQVRTPPADLDPTPRFRLRAREMHNTVFGD